MKNEYLIFKTPGPIDLDVIRTFGINVKENDNPIGHFGTGLKYAIAICLREGIGIKLITLENNEIEFGLKTKNIRGKEFEFITMGDEALGFTTELGKNWDLSQAYRELHTNTMDESGSIYVTDQIAAEAGHTQIVLTGRGIINEFHSSDKTFLKSTPLAECPALEIHQGDQSSKFYYRGIYVGDFNNPSVMKYNLIEEIQLTEDRTAKNIWDIQKSVTMMLMLQDDKDIIKQTLHASQGEFEHGIDYDYNSYEASEEWLAEARKLSHDYSDRYNPTIKAAVKKRTAYDVKKEIVEINELQRKMLAKSIAFCEEVLDCDFSDINIITVKSLGQYVLGMADSEKIFLPVNTFDFGTKYLAATLYEEYLHVSQGLEDESRDLQNFLFHKITSLGEQITGELL